jgi:hypothetical protein
METAGGGRPWRLWGGRRTVKAAEASVQVDDGPDRILVAVSRTRSSSSATRYSFCIALTNW